MAVYIIVIIIYSVVIITRNAVSSYSSDGATSRPQTAARKKFVTGTKLHRKISLSNSFWNICEELQKIPGIKKKQHMASSSINRWKQEKSRNFPSRD